MILTPAACLLCMAFGAGAALLVKDLFWRHELSGDEE